jgi:hypothetical protein
VKHHDFSPSDTMDVDLPISDHDQKSNVNQVDSLNHDASVWFDAVKGSVSLKPLFAKMNSQQIPYLEDFQDLQVSENAVLPLPNGIKLIGTSSNFSKLFIRSAMMDVWKVLDSEIKPVVLQGSPGCGKTSLVWLWALFQGCTKDVLYVSFFEEHCKLCGLQKGVIFASPKLQFAHANECGSFVERLLKNCAVDVLILDGVKNGTKYGAEPGTFLRLAQRLTGDFWFGRRLILLSSVQVSQRKARDYLSYQDSSGNDFNYSSKTIYMKSWSLEEYQLAFQLNDESLWTSSKALFPNLEDKSAAIKAKYFYAGGSARWMFGLDVEEIEWSIDEGLKRFTDAKAVLAGLHGQNASDTPNSVFQILDVSEDWFPVYAIVSQYALRSLAQTVGSEIFTIARSVAPSNSSYLGIIFEEEFEFHVKRDKVIVLDAYKQIRRNAVLYERSEHLQRIEKKVESISHFFFYADIPKDLSDGMFFVPTKVNQSYLDYAMLEGKGQELIVIQYTVGRVHSNNLENLRVFIKHLRAPIRRVSIFYVVDDLRTFSFSPHQSHLMNINELFKSSPDVEFFVAKPCYNK